MRRGNGARNLFASGITGYAVVGVITLQVLVPAVAFFDEPPTRFGFQMYSAQGGVSLKVLDDTGETVDVDLEGIVAGSLRPEFDWSRTLPEEICRATPEAARVTLEQSGRKTVVQCV